MKSDEIQQVNLRGARYLELVDERQNKWFPRRHVRLWAHVLVPYLKYLAKSDMAVLLIIISQVRAGNIARISRDSISISLEVAKNHVGSSLAKLKRHDLIREFDGIGFKLNPTLAFYGTIDEYKPAVDEWTNTAS